MALDIVQPEDLDRPETYSHVIVATVGQPYRQAD